MKKNRLVSAAIMTATVLSLGLGLSTNKLATIVKAETTSSDTSKIVAKLDKIEDGDTATFTYNGLSKPVQYLLIDTPETSKDQPYAEKAKKRGEALLKSAQKIEIEYDKGNHQNKNNQELMYVWVDGKLLQETLVKEGLARVTNSNFTLKKAEKNAKKQKLGIWSVEGYATKTGFKTKKYSSDKQVKSLTKKAKKALKLAEKTPTKENYNLAVSAINAIDGGDVALSKRLNAVNETITLAEQQKANAEKERKAAEQAAQAEQQRKVAEQAAQAEQQRVAAEQAAQAEQQRVAAEQVAQAEAAAQAAAAQEASANTNTTGANKWAIEDNYTWQTRKGHSTVIPPGGSLPPGYHWQVK